MRFDAQDATDHLPEPAIARDHDGRVGVRDLVLRALGVALGDPRQHPALEGDEGERREGHRDRDRGDEQARDVRREHALLDAEREQDERELADLGEREGEQPARRSIEPEHAGRARAGRRA